MPNRDTRMEQWLKRYTTVQQHYQCKREWETWLVTLYSGDHPSHSQSHLLTLVQLEYIQVAFLTTFAAEEKHLEKAKWDLKYVVYELDAWWMDNLEDHHGGRRWYRSPTSIFFKLSTVEKVFLCFLPIRTDFPKWGVLFRFSEATARVGWRWRMMVSNLQTLTGSAWDSHLGQPMEGT